MKRFISLRSIILGLAVGLILVSFFRFTEKTLCTQDVPVAQVILHAQSPYDLSDLKLEFNEDSICFWDNLYWTEEDPTPRWRGDAPDTHCMNLGVFLEKGLPLDLKTDHVSQMCVRVVDKDWYYKTTVTDGLYLSATPLKHLVSGPAGLCFEFGIRSDGGIVQGPDNIDQVNAQEIYFVFSRDPEKKDVYIDADNAEILLFGSLTGYYPCKSRFPASKASDSLHGLVSFGPIPMMVNGENWAWVLIHEFGKNRVSDHDYGDDRWYQRLSGMYLGGFGNGLEIDGVEQIDRKVGLDQGFPLTYGAFGDSYTGVREAVKFTAVPYQTSGSFDTPIDVSGVEGTFIKHIPGDGIYIDSRFKPINCDPCIAVGSFNGWLGGKDWKEKFEEWWIIGEKDGQLFIPAGSKLYKTLTKVNVSWIVAGLRDKGRVWGGYDRKVPDQINYWMPGLRHLLPNTPYTFQNKDGGAGLVMAPGAQRFPDLPWAKSEK